MLGYKKYLVVRDFGYDGGIDAGMDFDRLRDAVRECAAVRREFGRDVGAFVVRTSDNAVLHLSGAVSGLWKDNGVIYQISGCCPLRNCSNPCL